MPNWYVGAEEDQIHDGPEIRAGGILIAVVLGVPETRTKRADLIAAAPDMLKAIKRIVHNPEARIGGDIRGEAIRAIDKAEGSV